VPRRSGPGDSERDVAPRCRPAAAPPVRYPSRARAAAGGSLPPRWTTCARPLAGATPRTCRPEHSAHAASPCPER
jgi:hypothetical protein